MSEQSKGQNYIHKSLTPTTNLICLCLIGNYPKNSSMQEIVKFVYGRREPEWATSCIRAAISRSRKKLKELNLEIVGIIGQGYKIRQIVPMGGRLKDERWSQVCAGE